MKKLFCIAGALFTLALLANDARACRETRSYGTSFIEAQGNCRGIIGGEVGQCGPMNAAGTYWYCVCYVNCAPELILEELGHAALPADVAPQE